jgi:hypothetical protein
VSELKHSEQIGELAKALAVARKKFKAVRKEQTNPFFKSKYADLSAVIDATETALSEHGLSIVQSPFTQDGYAGVTTMLMHESGQWMRADLVLPVTKNDAQGVGSATTYARRYAYQAFVNVAAETDDDANSASGKETEAKAATMPKPPAKKPTNLFPELPKEAKPNGEESFSVKFWRAAKAARKTETAVREYMGNLGYEKTSEIPPTKHQEALDWAAGVGA